MIRSSSTFRDAAGCAAGSGPRCRHRRWKTFVILPVLTLLSATTAEGRGRAVALPGTPPCLTVFLLDGARQDVVFQELEAGRLPHIAAFGRQGAIVDKGVASFPSMTGYADYPVVTGLDSTRSGVLGLRWFDRSLDQGNLRSYVGRTNDKMVSDFAALPKLLYERFPDRYSFSPNTYANRGAKTNVEVGLGYARAIVTTDHGVTDASRNLDLREVLDSCCDMKAERDSSTHLFVIGWSEADQAASVLTSDGEATIRSDGERLSYTSEGADPFGYANDPRVKPLLDGQLHDTRVWLEATYDTGFPDAVYRVHRLLTASGVGDLVVTAANDWDLGKDYEVLVDNYCSVSKVRSGRSPTPHPWVRASPTPLGSTRLTRCECRFLGAPRPPWPSANSPTGVACPASCNKPERTLDTQHYLGRHGGLTRDQMTAWYVLAGPGVRRGARMAAARVEVVWATLFPLLGIEPEANGRILHEVLAAPARGSDAP